MSSPTPSYSAKLNFSDDRRLQIDVGSGETLLEAAERFCRKVGWLSGPFYTRLSRIPVIG